MQIYEKVFEILNKRSMSQKEFSEKTGIPQSTISDWKGKKVNPASDKIMIICQVLGVTPYDILSGTESEKYEDVDYVLINKKSDEFLVLEKYRCLTSLEKERVLGYFEGLTSKKNSTQ